jgi:hypothetical protein|tara:strand:- start:455 stop:637 length:183 start_codon:yes stop_codon:yes gene_type:complete
MKVTNEQLLAEMKSLSKIVEGNSTDIVELYRIINTGIGGVKVFVWVGTIVIAILGWRMTE